MFMRTHRERLRLSLGLAMAFSHITHQLPSCSVCVRECISAAHRSGRASTGCFAFVTRLERDDERHQAIAAVAGSCTSMESFNEVFPILEGGFWSEQVPKPSDRLHQSTQVDM